MPLLSLLQKFFKSKHERDYLRLKPTLEQVQSHRESFQALQDAQLQAKTAEFRKRLDEGEALDELLPEAFAAVWETCRRFAERGEQWEVMGRELTWDMVPYDVQIIGGISLHQGNIAEMATGEGKTLVATMPVYLNALSGRGVHIVTVNDYLAQRDAEWMGGIYRFLGMTVGTIRSQMSPAERRSGYACDITYGTNNEFGFDYLRDNMAVHREDLVQRGFFYAIVDEVDSVLIDEARTPLIISGPVAESRDRYGELKPHVEKIVRLQTRLLNENLAQVERALRQDEGELPEELALLLLQCARGGPKTARLLKLLKDHPRLQESITRIEGAYIRDKAMWEADKDLYYVIEEKQNNVDLTEKGREHFGVSDPDFFVLPDLSVELGEIEEDESLPPPDKARRVEELHRRYGERNEGIHSVQQLLKAYTLFNKDDEYVVQDGRIMIVDEFTGRLMHGRRYSDGLHSALEAKEGVKIQGETQTYATVTLQNYFRMYEKLAGMTGTAETEAPEFHEIYKLDVMVIPTHRPVTRDDHDDVIYRTKREKYNAIIDEVARLHEKGLPVLVGTTTVEVSETISRMLRRRSIPHNVLNAKQHQREAEIVEEAGRLGAVTIATNMAGRGTDIKLGPGVKEESGEKDGDPAGLHIIGSERHESRRIDRQLRGRSGRQGDPGASRFFLSLEDDLMRLFAGIEKISSLMERMSVEEGEVITHSMVTKAIERAQKRVEAHNFSIRKRLLEYDDVMNRQREVVYSNRREALLEDDISAMVHEYLEELCDDLLEQHVDPQAASEYWNWSGLSLDFTSLFLAPLPLTEDERQSVGEEVVRERLLEAAMTAYRAKEARLSPDLTRQLERYVVLRTIDELWKDHLHELDIVRGGIGLRAYGQKDPLLEYKAESFKLFEQMMQQVRRETVSRFFRYELAVSARPPESVMAGGTASKPGARPLGQGAAGEGATGVAEAGRAGATAIGVGAGSEGAAGVFRRGSATKAESSAFGAQEPEKGKTVVRDMPKVGRNDPCPCGSGLKYKKCHGRSA